jgi:hypothetical protein
MRHPRPTDVPAGPGEGTIVTNTATIITVTMIIGPVMMTGTTGVMTAGTTTTENGRDNAPGLAGSGALSACTYSLAWQMLLNKAWVASFNSACREIRSHGRQKRHRIPD